MREAFLIANTIKKGYSSLEVTDMEQKMVAYEFYWRDRAGKEHFIGILPERRKNPERITKESILNWGWNVIGNDSSVKNIYFVRVEM